MDYLQLISPLNGLMAGDSEDLLSNLLLLNCRALILLTGCFIVLRTVRGSATTRHFLITVTIASIVLLPFSMQLIPAFEITVEASPQPAVVASDHAIQTMIIGTTAFKPELLYPLCLAMYVFGFFFNLLKILAGNLKTFLLIKLSLPVKQPYWQSALGKYRQAAGLNGYIDLRYSNAVTSPSTWGAFSPVILLPKNALQWPDELIESTLLHELAHIKRQDWLVQQLARFICSMYWVNPFIWFALRTLQNNAEIACDDLAIRSGVRNIHYARNLVSAAEHALKRGKYDFAVLSIAGANHHSQLSDRILSILNTKEHRTPVTRQQAGYTLFFFLGMLVPLASLQANFIEHKVKDNNIENVHTYTLVDMPAIMPSVKHPSNTTSASGNQDEESNENYPVVLKKLLTSNASPPVINPEHATVQPDIRKKKIQKKVQPVKNIQNQMQAQLQPAQSLPNTRNEIHPGNDKQQMKGGPTGVDIKTVPEEVVLNQSPRNMVIPKYPYRARTRGIEGEVTVEYSIDQHGKVVDAEVISAVPNNTFDRQVLRAIKQSTFIPRRINGKPVATQGLRETYVFVLES